MPAYNYNDCDWFSSVPMPLCLSENVHYIWGELGHHCDSYWSSSSCTFLRTWANSCYLAFLFKESFTCPSFSVHPLLASFSVILFSLAAVPFHTTTCFCTWSQLTPGRGLMEAPHPLPWPGTLPSTSSHRRGKMAPRDAHGPKSRLLIEGWLVLNCNTLLLAMLTSCQISNSLNI